MNKADEENQGSLETAVSAGVPAPTRRPSTSHAPTPRPAGAASAAAGQATGVLQTPARAQATPASSPAVNDLIRADKIAAMIMAARREVRRGNRGKARELLQQVFALEPTDCGALELLGDIFMEEGEQEKALKVFERGKAYHPQHRAFEEKIAVCHLDLAEMEHDRLMRLEVLEKGVADKLLDRRPGLACSLSIFLPGAGQFYNDDNVRGGIFLGVAILAFCGWYWPLAAAIKPLSSKNQSGIDAISAGVSALSGFPRLLFWTMLMAWVATYIVAAIDAYMGAERANAQRRRAYGL